MPRLIAMIPFFTTALLAQGTVTVPTAYDTTDAPSRLWVAGVTADLHQQTIIDASHLLPLVGHDLTFLEFRRDADAEAFPGGSVTLTVRIDHAPMAPLAASSVFAANLPAPTTVWSGPIVVPNAPPAPGPNASWLPDRTLHIPFSTSFHYLGGPLTIDITGLANPTQPVPWWPADAAWDYASGTSQSVGVGCGRYANQLGEWASAAATTLVAGGMAQLSAHGTENGLALLFLGAPATLPGTALDQFIPGAAPGCSVFLPLPATLIVTSFREVPWPGQGGTAMHYLRLPNQPWVLGASFGSQWMDLQQQFATSNAVNCTVGPTAPTLGLVLVRAIPGEASGVVFANHAHVMRFGYQ